MAHHEVIVCCWKYGHETKLMMTKRQEEKLVQHQIPKLKAVCPACRDDGNGNQPIFVKSGDTLFSKFNHKLYRCEHGHITTVSAFNNDMLHTRFGPGDEEFINIEGNIEELSELINGKEITCHHVHDDGTICSSSLESVDDAVISYPNPVGIKTRTRVGDIWDRNGIEPVRQGEYDRDGNYHTTRTEAANRERLNRMRQRNISEERHPGKRVTKPTDRDYGRRSRDSIDFNE